MQLILLCKNAEFRTETESLLGKLRIRCVSFPERRAFLDHIREQNPGGKFIWFSDLDFSLLAYRLHADYFGLLPVTEEKLRTALQSVLGDRL